MCARPTRVGILVAFTETVNYAKNCLLTIVVLVVLCAAGSVLADKTDFLVNDDHSVVEQDHPRIAVSGDGDFVIVWVDRRSGSADIFLQRYTSLGATIGVNRRLNDDTGTAYQSEASVAVDLGGQYSVVWKDYRNGTYPFDPDVYLQRLDTSLTSLGTNSVLTVELPDSLKETPDVALSQWGNGVVVWADYRNRNWDIYGQLIAADGSRIGSNFIVNIDGGVTQQHAPRVAVSPEGWFVVTWYDSRNGNDDIYVQRFDASANRLGTNVKINSDPGTSRQAFPDVACDGAGHFTVVWVDWRNGVYPANPDIYARKFDTTMTPVAVDAMVNRDGSRRAQREPTIAADRRGNVAIIWSDSSGAAELFDIVGQMIDVDGVIREENFQANTESDSAQLQADVALDGRNRYITWADKRNGNYDIYASITQYNDPTLVPTPAALQFDMLVGGTLPPAQQLQIDHYGYNSLNFRVLRSQSWLQVTPSSGVTPATVNVSIATDTLPFGTYVATLTLHDVSNNDSTVQVSVRLNVASTILQLSEDTLHFQVFGGINDEDSQTLTISNPGVGELNWAAVEAIDWLQVDPASGPNSSLVTMTVNGLTLTEGTLLDSIVIQADGATNSHATVWLRVDVAANRPYLQLDPDSLFIATENPAAESAYAVVRNAGSGSLAWTAVSNASWLILSPSTGIDNDTVNFSIDSTGLTPGRYVSSVTFSDPGAYHPIVTLPFVLDYLAIGNDTIIVADLAMAPGESDSLPVLLVLHNSTHQVELPLSYNAQLASISSVSFGTGLPAYMTGALTLDSAQGLASIVVSSSPTDSLLAPGSYPVWLHLTAGAGTGVFELGEASAVNLAAAVVDSGGVRYHPTVLPGQVRIEGATAVEPDPVVELPTSFALAQNFPNPFNPTTSIVFQVPRLAEVQVEVFNILGQRVALLAQGIYPAGTHTVLWDTRLSDVREAPSGIYFYRLQAPGVSLVRKMILIK